MIPIVPTLALAFLSFLSSAFIILRIVLPILPPHPLSRRVAPSEFGLPNYRNLSIADKSHLWFASLDILALALFIWESVNQYTGGASDASLAVAPGSSLRLWIALTVRQTCLLMSVGLTLLHVRLGRSVSYGKKHWMLWAPTLVLIASSTGIAVVLAGVEVPSLFIGLVSYTTTIAVMSSIAFCCLVGTLLAIKRNLAAVEESEPWPAVRQMEQQPRPSFTTEEIDAIRDGASWITSNASNASSRHNSISAWSFSTHAPSAHGGRPQGSHPSVPAKSSFWFSSSTPPDAPPVPPLPSLYGPLSPTAQSLSDPDPFHRDTLEPRPRLDSQTSWLTSTNGSHRTVISAWSYPTTHHEEREGTPNGSTNNLNAELLPSSHTALSRPATPAMASAKVLGGYGFSPAVVDSEKNLAALAAAPGATVDISVYRAIGWLITIWVPLTLSLPYLLLAPHSSHTPTPASILLILSVTVSSPLLALNLLFRSPLPIPQGLFDLRGGLPANTCRGPSVAGSTPTYKFSHEYKRSTSASVTVVEGRRSGDVWLTNGDAVDGKTKMGRAIGMMAPTPKLSVLPPEENDSEPSTPPLPMQDDDSSLPVSIHNSTIQNSTQSEMSAQFGRLRKDSKASSHISAADESLAYASRIMVAQRHYSALAQTMRVANGSPEKRTSVGGHLIAASGVGPHRSLRNSAHLRTRSGSSIQQSPTTDSFNISPPPAFPLPPTPPNVRAARLAHLKHRKSFSSGFSFGPVDDMNEIDALTAGVLPLLVPGLKVGENMKIKEGDWTPPNSYSRAKGKRSVKQLHEFGEDFSSPQIHSTPARTRGAQPRPKKTSMHKRHHFSLPSLGLGKDGVHSLANWKDEVSRALENKVGQYTAVPSNVTLDVRRATVFGGESIANTLLPLRAVDEDEEPRPTRLVRGLSSRRLGLQASVPHSAHESMESLRVSMNIDVIPPSAASTATLFDDFEAGMDSGPQAESTPHNSVATKPVSKQRPPPLPLPVPNHVKSSRRSSIVYITSSEDNFSPRAPASGSENAPTTPSAMASLAQWSSRVIAKPGKLQRKISNAVHGTTAKPGSPGLRPLTLLQDRDINANGGGTPPLSLRKKHNKLRVTNDENAAPLADRGKGRGVLKPLGLVRTETRQQTEVA